MTPPDLDRSNALFLDLDGTLLGIGADAGIGLAPPGLPELLARLHALLGGALAIVTGRSIGVVDRLLAPFSAIAAGEHGVALRYQDGTMEEMPKGLAVPVAWREALEAAAKGWPGVLVEPKPHGVAIHYRLVPERGNDVWRLVRALVPEDQFGGFSCTGGEGWSEIVQTGRGVWGAHGVERPTAKAPFRRPGRPTSSATTSPMRPAWRPPASWAARDCAWPRCLAASRRPCAPGCRAASTS